MPLYVAIDRQPVLFINRTEYSIMSGQGDVKHVKLQSLNIHLVVVSSSAKHVWSFTA